MTDDQAGQSTEPGDSDVTVFTVVDDETLLDVVTEVIDAAFGITLRPVQGDALAAETDLGSLFVGVMGDLIVSMELRLPGEFHATPTLLDYLNDRNAGTTFVTFSVLDECLWVSGNVDGSPFAPAHLVRVLNFMFQAAVAVLADLSGE